MLNKVKFGSVRARFSFPFVLLLCSFCVRELLLRRLMKKRGRGSWHSEGLRDFCFVMLVFRFCDREEKSSENRGRAMPFLPLRSNDNGRTGADAGWWYRSLTLRDKVSLPTAVVC